jgi:hypothetical protein
LRQWRAARLQTRLEIFPVEWLTHRLCRQCQSEQPDTSSISRLNLPRAKTSAANMNGSERQIAVMPRGPWTRLRCRLQAWWTRARRRLVSKTLALGLRLVRWSLTSSRGNPKT